MLTGNCQTTAMGILPHKDVERALDLALSLDIPFWPQLPKLDFYEDMYVQASEHFPGMRAYPADGRLELDLEAFYAEMAEYVEHWEDEEYFRLSERYSLVYHRFLERDLSGYSAIRGQLIGPVSFGLKITDATKTPIIYHDEVRGLLYEFMARKVQAQYRELAAKNPAAFVWVDEPGLELLFMAMTGYAAETARADYKEFLKLLPGKKGVHLCGNPDWSFLLGLDLDILSADVLSWGYILTRYTDELRDFLERGGILSWGITPTATEEMEGQGVESMLARLEEMWDYLAAHGLDKRQLLRQAWLAPARCCLVNSDGTETVERSFALLREVSRRVREKYDLG